MIKGRPIALFQALCLCLAFATTATASETVRVGLWENNPMCYTDQDGNPAGIFVAVLEAAAVEEGWQLEYNSGSWAELRGKLEAGDIDVLPSMAVTAEREELYQFNNLDVFNNWAVVYTRPGSGIQSMLDLANQRVATMDRGIYSTGPEGIIKLNERFNLQAIIMQVPEYGLAMAAVKNGQADAAVVNRLFGSVHEQEFDLVNTGIVFAPVKIRFAMGRDNPLTPGLVSSLDKNLALLKGDNTSVYHHAIAEALGDSTHNHSMPGWVRIAIAVTLGLLVILALTALLLQWQVSRKTGELRWANTRLNEDIHKLQTAEEALSLSEERFRTLVENSSDWIWEFDENEIFTYASPRVKHLLGFESEEVVGKSAFEFIPEAERESVAKEFGPVKEARLSFANLLNVNQHRDGHLVTIESSGVPVIGRDGSFRGYRGIDRDITERREMETQLRQTYKMEAIGTLAGGIAHDFNNILSAIIGYTELAQAEIEPDQPARKSLDQVIAAGLRARDMVRQILTFSRKSELQLGPVNVAKVVDEAVSLLRASIPTTIEFQQQISADTGLVWADSTQLHQVIMNLCTNAAQAMKDDGGVLGIELSRVQVSPTAATAELQAGNYMRLAVSDTGPGIEPTVLKRIFDPYFTTKQKEDGTGMGLAVVHGIVQSHKGVIRTISKPGLGTTFRVYLPELKDEVRHAQNSALSLSPGRGERILFVDDEPSIAAMAKQLLPDLGYTVDIFTSSSAALAKFHEATDRYDLIITDQTMPDLTGIELSRETHRLNPKVPVLLCSGYSAFSAPEALAEDGVQGFLVKPFGRDDLAKAIRNVLDEIH
ncbi:MAG: PAS domain S-box protein [Candidatus Krumholzibacteria bacterium]|nr:PAS domain S-box protein [Candidatus Krumholzibacteria bacterium]